MEERLNQRMDGMAERLNQRTSGVDKRLATRADGIESVATLTRAEMLDLRADFRDLNIKLKEHFPILR
jgi:DNA-binding transcriptional regulator YdaS (Cro superfamily)